MTGVVAHLSVYQAASLKVERNLLGLYQAASLKVERNLLGLSQVLGLIPKHRDNQNKAKRKELTL